jgi:hypothetical protein
VTPAGAAPPPPTTYVARRGGANAAVQATWVKTPSGVVQAISRHT